MTHYSTRYSVPHKTGAALPTGEDVDPCEFCGGPTIGVADDAQGYLWYNLCRRCGRPQRKRLYGKVNVDRTAVLNMAVLKSHRVTFCDRVRNGGVR